MQSNGGEFDYTSTVSQIRSSLEGEKATEEPSYTTEATLAVPVPDAKPGGKKKKNRGISPNSTVSSNGSTEKLSETLISPSERGKPPSGDDPKAMMLDRGVEGGLDGVIGLGPSRGLLSDAVTDGIGLIGFDGLIIEEDIDSGGITSLLIFRHDP